LDIPHVYHTYLMKILQIKVNALTAKDVSGNFVPYAYEEEAVIEAGGKTEVEVFLALMGLHYTILREEHLPQQGIVHITVAGTHTEAQYSQLSKFTGEFQEQDIERIKTV